MLDEESTSRVDNKSKILIISPGFLTNLRNGLGKFANFMGLSPPSTKELTSETRSNFNFVSALGLSFSLGWSVPFTRQTVNV